MGLRGRGSVPKWQPGEVISKRRIQNGTLRMQPDTRGTDMDAMCILCFTAEIRCSNRSGRPKAGEMVSQWSSMYECIEQCTVLGFLIFMLLVHYVY